MKSRRLLLILNSLIIFSIHSCKPKIRLNERVAVVGKILAYPVAAKGGAEKITYVYLGKKYFDVARFDSRKFTYGDKFIMYIDRNDPDNIEIPRPVIKFRGLNYIKPDERDELALKQEDLQILDSIPIWK